MCFILMYAHIHFVFSFNDFTKTVFMMRKDKEYLFTESTVCVTHGGGIIRKRQRAKQTVLVPGEGNRIALLWSRP